MGDYEITVDENDNPIGSKHWRDMSYDDIYRISTLWLTDIKTGDVLIAQRKWNKKNDPGKWGVAAAGTVEVGETYRGNMIKEIEEEIGLTGLKLTKGPKKLIDDGEHRLFCQMFFASVDKNKVMIKIQEEEVEAAKWVSKKWLLDDVQRNPQNYTLSIFNNMQVLGISY